MEIIAWLLIGGVVLFGALIGIIFLSTMGYFSFLFIKELKDPTPPLNELDQIYNSTEDDASKVFSRFTFLASINRVFYLEYIDSQGEITERKIKAHSINKTEDGNYILYAHCELRKENRSFRIDRIHKLTDARNNVIDDPEKFFLSFKKDVA